MLRKVFFYPIPFYVLVVLLAVAAVGVFAWREAFRQAAYRYEFQLPSALGVGGQQFEYGSWPALSDPNFFQSVHDKFVGAKASFVEADLSAMRLRVYRDGTVAGEFPILTVGRVGSWWETPAGLYKIEAKEKDHFSSFGRVYMPWSMAFQGNFYIHGWPYEPDGTPVASTYSGGCIRLSTEDARAVYDMASVGMPVLVYKNNFTADVFRYRTGPSVGAPEYLAADLTNNFVFASASSTVPVPVASLTKLMAALVATEYINLDESIGVRRDMLIKTSKPRLVEGTYYTAYQLLYPLLEESSNEAALALAEFLGRERFVSLMNEKAAALGMSHTRFTDPAGMDDGNVSTAEDLFALAKYLYHNRSFILKLSAGHVGASAYELPNFPSIENFNVFADSAEFVGGKVGESTAAGKAIVAVFNHHFGNAVRPLVVVVLESSDNAADAGALLSYVSSTYSGAP